MWYWEVHLSSPRCSVVVHLCRSGSMVGEMFTELSWFISMRIMGPRVLEARWWHLTAIKPGDNNYYVCKDQEVLTQRESWRWLIDYDVLRSKIGGQPRVCCLPYLTATTKNGGAGDEWDSTRVATIPCSVTTYTWVNFQIQNSLNTVSWMTKR